MKLLERIQGDNVRTGVGGDVRMGRGGRSSERAQRDWVAGLGMVRVRARCGVPGCRADQHGPGLAALLRAPDGMRQAWPARTRQGLALFHRPPCQPAGPTLFRGLGADVHQPALPSPMSISRPYPRRCPSAGPTLADVHQPALPGGCVRHGVRRGCTQAGHKGSASACESAMHARTCNPAVGAVRPGRASRAMP
jgi:hypothetical protein